MIKKFFISVLIFVILFSSLFANKVYADDENNSWFDKIQFCDNFLSNPIKTICMVIIGGFRFLVDGVQMSVDSITGQKLQLMYERGDLGDYRSMLNYTSPISGRR